MIIYVKLSLVGLQQLCETISTELKRSRSASVPSGEWHQRIERRKETWEAHRTSLFEHVVSTKGLLETNVSI